MRKISLWVTAAALLMGSTLGVTSTSQADATALSGRTSQLTVLSTTDTHGNALNWDYFRNAPYSDSQGNEVGLAKAATVIDKVRAQRGANSVVVVDNGDTIQGTPLDYYFAKKEPITSTGEVHPMAAAFNAIGYDASNVGNHEFNYGWDLLHAYQADLNSPLLAANVVDVKTGQPAFQPYTIVTRKPSPTKRIKIGILGLTQPGSMVWDKGYLEGKVTITDLVTAAKQWVPRVKAAGADVVVVLSHAGEGSSVPAGPGVGPENPSDQIAKQVPGVDVVVMGHTHRTVPDEHITNDVTGEDVLLVQPRQWASSVNEVTLDLAKVKGKWDVTQASGQDMPVAGNAEDPTVASVIAPYHSKAVAYVNQVIATSVAELPAAKSRYQDTPIIDYIQRVQTQTVTQALAGGPLADKKVLSIAAPFSRSAVFPKGDVTVRDMAGLYIYDNTLKAVTMTGDQVKDYLEYSASYFAQVTDGTFDPATDTNAPVNGHPQPDYNYDIISGLNYTIDVSKPVGQRVTITGNSDGTPYDPGATYVVAVNNYRQSGGGGFPHMSTAPVVYDEQAEIRQLLIDWASARGVIDPADFYVENWYLTVGDVRIA